VIRDLRLAASATAPPGGRRPTAARNSRADNPEAGVVVPVGWASEVDPGPLTEVSSFDSGGRGSAPAPRKRLNSSIGKSPARPNPLAVVLAVVGLVATAEVLAPRAVRTALGRTPIVAGRKTSNTRTVQVLVHQIQLIL